MVLIYRVIIHIIMIYACNKGMKSYLVANLDICILNLKSYVDLLMSVARGCKWGKSLPLVTKEIFYKNISYYISNYYLLYSYREVKMVDK